MMMCLSCAAAGHFWRDVVDKLLGIPTQAFKVFSYTLHCLVCTVRLARAEHGSWNKGKKGEKLAVTTNVRGGYRLVSGTYYRRALVFRTTTQI